MDLKKFREGSWGWVGATEGGNSGKLLGQCEAQRPQGAEAREWGLAEPGARPSSTEKRERGLAEPSTRHSWPVWLQRLAPEVNVPRNHTILPIQEYTTSFLLCIGLALFLSMASSLLGRSRLGLY